MRFPLALASAVVLVVLAVAAPAAEPSGASTDSLEQRVAQAVKFLPSATALQALQELTDQASPRERMQIIGILEQQRRFDARPVVVSCTRSPDPSVAKRALEALVSLGSGSAADHESVAACLASSDERIRRSAIACLNAWRDLRAVPALAKKLRGDTPLVASEAGDALVAITGQKLGDDPQAWSDWYDQRESKSRARFDELVAHLRSDKPAVVIAAIADLAGMTDRRNEVVERLKPLVRDPDDGVAAAAIAVLKSLAPQELVGVEDVQAPPVAARPAPTKPAPPVDSGGGISWGAIVVALAVVGCGWWWVRRLTTGTQGPSVAQVVAQAQREADMGSERKPPAQRTTRPAPVGARKQPPSGPKPAPEAKVGKRDDKTFKLD